MAVLVTASVAIQKQESRNKTADFEELKNAKSNVFVFFGGMI
jgi:hypothetical protein